MIAFFISIGSMAARRWFVAIIFRRRTGSFPHDVDSIRPVDYYYMTRRSGNAEIQGKYNLPLIYKFKKPAVTPSKRENLMTLLRRLRPDAVGLETEYCFYIESTGVVLPPEEDILDWLLSETFEPENFSSESFLTEPPPRFPSGKQNTGNFAAYHYIVEVGPRLNFTTAWSTNAVSICRACGLSKITRIERSRRYRIESKTPLDESSIEKFANELYDRMTECTYPERLITFETGIRPEAFYYVPLIEKGRSALEKINAEMGLGLDDWDIDYYYNLFVNDIGRNPTNVECFDLSQSNSEHSRHWFFRGGLIIDGKEAPENLMSVIRKTLDCNPGNSVIAFRDNSSAIKGYEIETITPAMPGKPSRFEKESALYHIIFTAETHNFPSGVAPFPGAETGTGGRIRDVQATGRGALVVAGTAAYCVGNLLIPGYILPWEDGKFIYPSNLARALTIEIEASNGASDYGNKFGEPVIQGYTRSFGLRMPDGERREWIKPIMFTGGVGQIDSRHISKRDPEKGMLVTKVGGPAYRIGMGGGSASSMIQGQNVAELDFNAVQRGDAEMEQKMNRVVRACVEMGDHNPIVSIHDQGAGGNCNVVKEIIYPAGARIEIRQIPLGDTTLSVLEIWGAEYQEQNALLIRPDRAEDFLELCRREKVPCAFIGTITGDGYIVLHDETDGSTPVNLHLDKILGDMPGKTFSLERIKQRLEPLNLPDGLTVKEALNRVLRLLSVGSKRFLANKVDRSVTGLVARQQCCGPLQVTVSDVAVIAQSHLGITGAAISIGEQPVKGLINPEAMARLSVAEALTNMVWAKISGLGDIKCSGNWMWAPKLPGEGADLYDAAVAMRDIMLELGIAVDGGKDSLSMAARVTDSAGHSGTVKSPGTLVISAYASCPDITKVVTPDIKKPGQSRLLFIDAARGKNRLGGSAFAQCYEQVGDESPDIDDIPLLKRSFTVIQQFISENLIEAGHDRSDGGLIVTLLEMAFAGNCGIEVSITQNDTSHMSFPFSSANPLECGQVKRVGNPSSAERFSPRRVAPPAHRRVRRGEEDDRTSRNDKLHSYKDAEKWEGHSAALAVLFSEEPGMVIEYLPENEDTIFSVLKDQDIPFQVIGKTTEEKRIVLTLLTPDSSPLMILDEDVRELRGIWEETSYQLDRLQRNPSCAEEEKINIYDRGSPPYRLSFVPVPTPRETLEKSSKPRVAVIREEGSNGDREMISAFYMAGFEPWDVTMTDFIGDRIRLEEFRGAVFVGGFSYADVLDSAKGWSGVIRFNSAIWRQFRDFYHRNDTFSLGVCNGCQLMALLGWVPWEGISGIVQPRFIHNKSGRFESRFAAVTILESPAVMLKGMENSVLGIWVAHGEGLAYFPDDSVREKVIGDNLAPVRYVDDKGDVTGRYPFNPNGSPDGIASLCSPDGRHLAMMPHPERTFLKWQWGWMPEDWKKDLKASPWLRMFQNARQWCEEK